MKQRFTRNLTIALTFGGMAVPFTAAYADTLVKIGMAGPLSGPQAHYGKDDENCAKLAVEELNAKGLTIGGQKVKFELISEDDQADPRVGTQVAQRLVDQGVKAILGHFNSGVTIPTSRIYSEAGIPQLTVSTNPTYTKQGYKTAFRLMGSDSQIGGALGKYAVQSLKAKSIAVIDDRTAYGQGLADEFAKAVGSNGGQIARREFTTDKSTDFTAILTSLKAIKPDVIFYGGADAQAAPMAKQIARLGIKAKLLGGDMLETENFINMAGADANGHYAAVSGVDLKTRPAGKEFEKRYQARFKQEIVLFGPYYYDAVMLVAEAMKKANSAEPAKYLPQLAKIRYPGVTSEFAFDANGNLLKAPVTISVVNGGKWAATSVVQ